MMTSLSNVRAWFLAPLLVALGAAAVACAGEPPKVDAPPPPTAEPVAPAETAAPDDAVAPAATAAPEAAPDKPVSSGRPAIQIGPQKKIQSAFGSTPASVLVLKTNAGSFTLKLTEFALRGPVNLLVEVGGRGVQAKGLVGEIVKIETQLADSPRFSAIKSAGPAFEVIVPLAKKKSVNLAVGALELTEDGALGTKVKEWRVYAPLRVDEGLGEAVFELTELVPGYLHATTAAPTVTPAAPTP